MALFRKSPTENTQSLVQRIEELEAVLAQLELVAETAQISWWEANLQTGAVLWSRSLLQLLELAPEAPLTAYLDRMESRVREEFNAKMQKLLLTGESFELEHSLRTADGEQHLRLRCTFHRSEVGQRLVGILQNITAERNRELERRNMALVAAKTSSGVLFLDAQRRVVWLNPGLTGILSWSLEDLQGQDPFDRFICPQTPPELIERLNRGWAEVDSFAFEGPFQDKFGNALWLEFSFSPVLSPSTQLLGEELLNYVVLVNDISDRKAKEAAILKLNEALQQKNEDILDSIRYAQRIQFALLPNLDELFWAYPDSFVLYRPKDIVSGDFYWYRFVGPYLYVAAIDCTGHGVPGAFMSVLGNSILNELLGDGSTPEPAQLIQELDRRVEATLRREHGTNEAVNDGMDLALVRIDRLNQHLDFAGANRPLVVLRQGQLHELRGDAFSIGFQVLLTDQSAKQFTGHTWSLEAGDRIVLFTDGISDQFGGDRAKKWGKKNFYAALEAQVNASGPEMKWSLETALDRWRGSLAQTDDVLVICLGIG
jgi:serine phosphatase RsbU (regulator of sigma subunit)